MMEIVVPDEYAHLWEFSKERPVVKYPNEVLRTKAKPVQKVSNSTKTLISKMETILKMANGVGLAAPQIGVPERVILVAPELTVLPLINPEITHAEGEAIGIEGCLSLPGLYGEVKRAAIVEVKATDKLGKSIKLRFEGLGARVVQHEIDHLEGVLFIDKVDLATLHWAMPASRDAE